MRPANSLVTIFEDIVLIPSWPKGEAERRRLQALGYRYLCTHSAGFHPPLGLTAYAKPLAEFSEFVNYYQGFGGCYFNFFAVDKTLRVFCYAEQIISSRHVADIELVGDLGIPIADQAGDRVTPRTRPIEASSSTVAPAPAPLPPRRPKMARHERPSAAGAVKRLDDFTRQVLAEANASGNVLKLSSQLSEEDYERVDAVLRKIGGRWNRSKGGHVFPFPIEDMIAEAVASSSFVDRKQDLQLFETPPDRCETMVDRLNVQPGDLALEPSAGTGRLVRALKRRGALVTAVEIDPTNAASLAPLCDNLEVGDFLAFVDRCATLFDVIAMNPPFTRGQDMAHVQAAFRLLKPGGRLSAIVSESAFHRDTRQAGAFRAWLKEIGADVEAIEAGAFSKSGTVVATRMIVATAPAEPVPAPIKASYDYGPLFARL